MGDETARVPDEVETRAAAPAIELNDESTWPAAAAERLEGAVEMLRAYEQRRRQIDRRCETDVFARCNPPPNEHADARARLLYALADDLRHRSVLGYHCTRLHSDEIAEIKNRGLRRLSPEFLAARIKARECAGDLSSSVARRLLAANEAGEDNRRGMTWFVFTTGPLAEEDGVGRFFTYWGGESLYWRHEHDEEVARALRSVGVACIVECAVPIARVQTFLELPERLVVRFLHHRRIRTEHSVDCEGYVREDLPGVAIRAVVQSHERRFARLTLVRRWESDPRGEVGGRRRRR